MKKLFKSPILTFLAALAIILPACTTGDDEPGPGGNDIELSLADIVGFWGIQSTTVGNGTPQTTVPCDNTIEIQPNGNFVVVNAKEGTWREGNAAFDQADSTVTLTVSGQVIEFKLLSVSDDSFEFGSTDNSGGTAIISTDRFVKLEDSDCASITSAALEGKWSIEGFERKGYEITEGEIGDLLGTETQDNVPYNMFTIEFKSGGGVLMIDLVNEYRYQIGTYRNLDDHNFIVEFESEDGTSDETLVHLTSNTDNSSVSFSISEEDEDNAGELIQIITEFDLMKNDGSEPTISEEDWEGKWSATSIAERAFLQGQMVGEFVDDQIAHNKLTIEIFDDGGVQLIDLHDDIGYQRGEWEFLDGSNILLNLGDGDDEEEFELFHVTASGDDSFTIKSFEGPEHHDDGGGDGSGGGEANDGHEFEYDLKEFEVSANKNAGNEPSIMEEEFYGTWNLIEVENLNPNAGGDPNEGPQEGMVLTVLDNGTGEASFQGNVVAAFEYHFLDESNIKFIFEDSGDGDGGDGSGGGEANDDHEEEVNYTIFHISDTMTGSILELILYEPGRDFGDGGDGSGGDGTGGDGSGGDNEEDNGGATYRIKIQKVN